MNQLMVNDNGYPFLCFPENAFHKGMVVTLVSRSYEKEIGSGKTPVPQPHIVAMSDIFLVTLAKIGRIVHLGEDHNDLFFDSAANEAIREKAAKYNNDLIRVTKEYMLMSKGGLPADLETFNMFEADIKKVYDSEHMFYLDSSIPYASMQYLRTEGEESPFSEENIRKFFRNIPIGRVW